MLSRCHSRQDELHTHKKVRLLLYPILGFRVSRQSFIHLDSGRFVSAIGYTRSGVTSGV